MRTLRPAFGGLAVATAALSLAALSPAFAQSPDASISVDASMPPLMSFDPCASPAVPTLPDASGDPSMSMAPVASMVSVRRLAALSSATRMTGGWAGTSIAPWSGPAGEPGS